MEQLPGVVLEQSPVGVAVFDPDGCCVRVNPALERLTGLTSAESLGHAAGDVLPGTVGRFARAVLGEVLLTGVPVVGAEVEERTPAGGDRSFLLSFCRLDGEDGSVLGAAAFVVDVSDRRRTRRALERANARLELLGRAAAVLSASLDLQRTLDHLGRLVVPDFADHCIVDLVDDDPDVALRLPPGTVRRYAIVHAPGLGGPGAWSPVGLPVTYPPSHPVHATLTTGRVSRVDVDPGDFDYRAVAPTETSARYAREVGVRAAISVPLRARGQIVGAASFALSASGRRYDDEDELLAVQLADRAAVAIDNARTHEREQRHGLTLQRRLLPARLPQAPGLRAAATYLPAGAPAGRGAGTQVGGDWYDLVPLPGGRVAIVVGDVMGRGVQAAALMGQVRAGLRAYAVQDLPPGDVLTAADELVRGLDPEGDDEVIVTCVYAVYDPRDEQLVVANAGHVPPLVLGTGAPDGGPVPATGPPLGAGGREPYGQVVLALPAEHMLALYTDGLVETREADLDAGIRRLAALLDPVPDDLEAACAVVTGVLTPGPQSDDVAVLLVRPDPATRPPVERLLLEPGARAAGAGRDLVRRTLAGWGEPPAGVEVAELAVSELVTNAVRHGQGPVTVQLSRHADGVVVEVADGAAGTPRWRRAAPDDEGGRGVLLVAELADAWGVRPGTDGGKTVWCRIGRRPPRRA